MLHNNWIALVFTLALALAWLRLMDSFAHRGKISGPLSRKIIHIGTGPIFVLCWLLFDQDPNARYLAAIVPLGISVQFFLVGLGVLKDKAAVDAMARTGDRKEILRGPFYYGIVFVILTIWFWKDSPIGMIALMLLCGGDGLADVVGKRLGKARLPWAKEKSWAGTLAMFFGGWVFSIFILAVFIAAGVFVIPFQSLIVPVTIIALVGTAVESIPLRDYDNITVPAAAVLLGYLLIH